MNNTRDLKGYSSQQFNPTNAMDGVSIIKQINIFSFFFYVLHFNIFYFSVMVECSSVTVFAAIGAAFIGYKVLSLLKTLFDSYVATGISVSIYETWNRLITMLVTLHC